MTCSEKCDNNLQNVISKTNVPMLMNPKYKLKRVSICGVSVSRSSKACSITLVSSFVLATNFFFSTEESTHYGHGEYKEKNGIEIDLLREEP